MSLKDLPGGYRSEALLWAPAPAPDSPLQEIQHQGGHSANDRRGLGDAASSATGTENAARSREGAAASMRTHCARVGCAGHRLGTEFARDHGRYVTRYVSCAALEPSRAFSTAAIPRQGPGRSCFPEKLRFQAGPFEAPSKPLSDPAEAFGEAFLQALPKGSDFKCDPLRTFTQTVRRVQPRVIHA